MEHGASSINNAYFQKFAREKSIATYINSHNLTDSMDALVAGLVVLRPKDPLTWCISSLNTLADMPDYSITWDCLIPVDKRPKSHSGNKALGYLDEIFRLGASNDIPDPRMFETAYNHYYRQLKLKAWKGWIQYRLYKIKKRETLRKRLEEARDYYKKRGCREIIKKWKLWTEKRILASQQAELKLRHVWESYFQTSIIDNWLEAAKESKTTRLYFEKLERGESSLNAEELEHLGIDLYRDPISMLDRKVALQIFSRLNLVDLTTCMQVCRAWKVLTNAPSLWSKINFYECRHKFSKHDDAVAGIISKNHAYSIHLNMMSMYNLEPQTLKIIGQCHNLQDLNLAECNGVTDSVISNIVAGCTGLLYLNLSSTSITDNCLKEIGRCCLVLRNLNINNCLKFTDRGLHSLAMGKGCKKLVYLDISKCPQITIQGYYSIAKGFPCLETLKLALNYTINDQAVIQSVQKLTTLKTIDLQKCIDLTDQSIKYLAECRTLTKISLDQMHKVSDGALRALAKYCPCLEEIYIVDCARITDLTLKVVAQLESLKVLNISDCSRISDTGIRYLTEGNSQASLKKLDCTNVHRLTDISLFRIGKSFTNIRRLSLAYCENLSDSGIEYILSLQLLYELDLSGTPISDDTLAKIGKMASISQITISECSYISDTGLGKFCSRIKEKLKSLDISHCKDITDKPMKIVAYNCRFLKSVNLAGCWRLTDETPICLGSVCTKIETFDISGCYQVTDGSLRHLKKLKNLQLLILKFCRNVTAKGFYMIKEHVPEVYYDHDDAPHWFGYDKIPFLATMEAGDIKPKEFLDSDDEKKQRIIDAISSSSNKKKGKGKKKKRGAASAASAGGSSRSEGVTTEPDTAATTAASTPATSLPSTRPSTKNSTRPQTGRSKLSLHDSDIDSKSLGGAISEENVIVNQAAGPSGPGSNSLSRSNSRTNLESRESRRESQAFLLEQPISEREEDDDEALPMDRQVLDKGPVTKSFSLTDGSFYRFNSDPLDDLPAELADSVRSSRASSRCSSRPDLRDVAEWSARSIISQRSSATIKSNTRKSSAASATSLRSHRSSLTYQTQSGVKINRERPSTHSFDGEVGRVSYRGSRSSSNILPALTPTGSRSLTAVSSGQVSRRGSEASYRSSRSAK